MKTRSADGKLKAIKYDEDVMSDNQESEACPSDCNESSDDNSILPQKKRQSYACSSSKSKWGSIKARKGKSRGKNVGKLSKLFDMPVEIFSEVASHLEPLDLLRFSRSTRGLNQVLMSRNSRPIWRAARSSFTGLPDCPPDLSEPEYARLLFEKDCQICLASRATKVDWTLRSRLCKRCRTDRILKGYILLKEIPDLTEELLRCIPSHANYWAADNHREFEYYSVRVHALVAKYRTAVPEGLPASQTEVHRERFINQHKALIPVIAHHAASVEDWLDLQQDMKLKEDAKKTERRVSEIHNQLIALGYQKAEFPYPIPRTEWYKIVHQPRDLTPQIWNRLRPRLEACIQMERIKRKEVQLHGNRNERRSELYPYLLQRIRNRQKKDTQLFMYLNDVLALPTVEAILAENDSRVPITDERWNESKHQVEKEMDEFSEKIRTDLITDIIARKGATSSPNHAIPDTAAAASSSEVNLDFLLLPTTCFECVYCGSRWCHYPDMLTHQHGWSSSWNPGEFRFNVAATELAQTILASLPGDIRDSQVMIGKAFQCLRCGGLKGDLQSLISHIGLKMDAEALDEKRGLNTEPDCHDIKLATHLATILTVETAVAEWGNIF